MQAQHDELSATPKKLRSGNWGALVQTDRVEEGDSVRVTTRSGKSWLAIIDRVIWRGRGVAIAATRSVDRPQRSRGGPRECTCGACDDLLSTGYRPGQRVRCPECGGWAEAV